MLRTPRKIEYWESLSARMKKLTIASGFVFVSAMTRRVVPVSVAYIVDC